MSDIPRRRLLAVTGVTTAAAIAGCSGSDDDSDDADENGTNGDGDDPDPDPDSGEDEPGTETDDESDVDVEDDGTVLGNIDIENLSEETHTIDVIVEFDGVFEDWKTVTLEGRTGTTLDRNWPTDPGSIRVIGRLDEGDPIERSPARWNDPDCLNLDVLVRNNGLDISGRTDGGPCDNGDE